MSTKGAYVVRARPINHVDTVQMYMDMRGPFLTLDELEYVLGFDDHPAHFNNVFDKCIDIFADDLDKFLESVWSVLLTSVSRHENIGEDPGYDAESWKLFMSKFISVGFDVHSSSSIWYSSKTPMKTSLWTISMVPASAIQLLECSHKWLRILELGGINIDDYLRAELALLIQAGVPDLNTLKVAEGLGRQDYLLLLLDRIRPELGLLCQEEGQSDLFKIMPGLRFCHCSVVQTPLTGTENMHREWKSLRNSGWANENQWPFVWELDAAAGIIESYRHAKSLRKDGKLLVEGFDRACELEKSRFERRQVTKWRKLQKNLGLRMEKDQMPGSWEEEWWET